MADAPMPGKTEFSAVEERLQRASRSAANATEAQARFKASNPNTVARRAAFDTAFGADQAQKARDKAATTTRNSRAMPDAFPVPQIGEQDE